MSTKLKVAQRAIERDRFVAFYNDKIRNDVTQNYVIDIAEEN